MTFLILFVFSLLIISCDNEKNSNVLKRHTPFEDLTQKIENKDALKFYDKGWDQSERGNLKTAKIAFEKSLEIEQNPLTFNELGRIERVEKNYNKAINYYEQGRTLDSLFWPLYINEARTYWKLNEFEKSEDILKKLKGFTKSDYWIAYADFYLAITYYNSGQPCSKVQIYLEKSESILSDPDLKEHYLKFKNLFNKNCG